MVFGFIIQFFDTRNLDGESNFSQLLTENCFNFDISFQEYIILFLKCQLIKYKAIFPKNYQFIMLIYAKLLYDGAERAVLENFTLKFENCNDFASFSGSG